jgi:Zn-dependent hydrolases, including glyoxylases
MNFEIVKTGYLRTNCYIMSKNNKVIVIDPADEYHKIKEVIGDKEVVGVIITHHHPDHVGALEFFEGDLVYDYFNMEEGMNKIGPFEFEIIYTPGHKEDSISIYFKEDKKMITGDFLFRNAIGRTDFPGGSMTEMINSLKKISNYPADVEVYPGHGGSTTLGIELKNHEHIIK